MTHISAGIIVKDNKVLITQRKRNSYYELKWEFPGGKKENSETIEECLKRELKEELYITISDFKLIHIEDHKYPDGFEFRIFFYLINNFYGQEKNKVFEKIEWTEIENLDKYDFLEADKKIISLLKSHFQKDI